MKRDANWIIFISIIIVFILTSVLWLHYKEFGKTISEPHIVHTIPHLISVGFHVDTTYLTLEGSIGASFGSTVGGSMGHRVNDTLFLIKAWPKAVPLIHTHKDEFRTVQDNHGIMVINMK